MPKDRDEYEDELDPDPLMDDIPGREAGRPGFVPEFVRKVAVAGLGAIFMTEEGIRNLAGQMKLPKEVLAYILSQAEKTKGEVGRVVSEEVRRFLQSDKLREEFVKLLSGMTIEVKAQIRMVPKGQEDDEPSEPKPKVVVTELNTRRGGKRSKKE
jgi:hypothetical protein